MRMARGRWLAVAVVAGLTVTAQAALKTIARDPYIGAIVTDADSGKVIVEVNADARAYPASVCKLMTLMVVLDRLDKGVLHSNDMVHVTKEAARTGGSQVYLKENEQFTVDEMLYALIVQSANDAATALALHVAGSKEAFVLLMNQRAAALGMTRTHFFSVHGLPPGAGQQPDVSTARDLALLSLELVKRPDVLRYSSTREKGFRGGTFGMRTHNHLLLEHVDGVDGLKTGWWPAAGYSMAITAKRAGRRVIVVTLGSAKRFARDKAATELLARGFANLPPPPPPPPVATNAVAVSNAPAIIAPAAPVSAGHRRNWAGIAIIGVGVLVIVGIAVRMLTRRRTE